MHKNFVAGFDCPVSSEISDFAPCAHAQEHSTYQIRWENWWLGHRIWCLGKCVR